MIIGSFSFGSASAVEYSTIEDLLVQLPDNTAKLIDASDVRDSIYTLWRKTINIQTPTASYLYTNTEPIFQQIGGILPGDTFATQSMQQMWDRLLYPYVELNTYITGGDIREFGSSNAVSITWSVSKGSEYINSIVVNTPPLNGATISGNPWNTDQTGNIVLTATTNIDTTFQLLASDIPYGTTTSYAYTTVNWVNRRYWGTLATSSVLTTASSSVFSHSDLSGLSSELSNDTSQVRTITTNNDYVVFVWPSNAIDLSSNPAHVTIGGLNNTNWLKTRSGVQFTNQWGYTGTTYDVWIFDGVQAPNTFTYVIS